MLVKQPSVLETFIIIENQRGSQVRDEARVGIGCFRELQVVVRPVVDRDAVAHYFILYSFITVPSKSSKIVCFEIYGHSESINRLRNFFNIFEFIERDVISLTVE